MPIAILLGITTMVSLFFFTTTPLHIITQQMFNALDNFVLLAIPFFIVAGGIMTRGSIARKLVNFINALVGWFPGGLAIAGVIACIFFAAISGSSTATVVAIGAIMFPALKKAGYDEKFNLGLITSAGSLGIIIPPSIPMILYCLVVNVSVAEMFMAGILPGILIGFALILYTFFQAKKNNWRVEKKASFSEIVTSARKGFWALILPIIVLGGIYSGLFTPTEAAAISVVYALIVEIFIYKEFRIKDISSACNEAAVLSACLLFILCCAMTFIWLLTAQELPNQLADLIIRFIDSPFIFLLVVNVFLLAIGCVMEGVSAVLILAPLFLETLNRLEIDLVHFGVIMVLNIQLGMLTPPFGINLFVASGISKQPLYKIAMGIFPFLIVMLVCLLLITYVPAVSLFLPNWILG
jgi:C4-dicarboxylate transporter DctM subunit